MSLYVQLQDIKLCEVVCLSDVYLYITYSCIAWVNYIKTPDDLYIVGKIGSAVLSGQLHPHAYAHPFCWVPLFPQINFN